MAGRLLGGPDRAALKRNECDDGFVASFASHLRVYGPIAAFPAGERVRWEGYLESGAARSRSGGLLAEHRAAVVAAIGLPPDPSVEHAFVHRIGGRTYVCPWRTRLRGWHAMTEFRAS